MSKTHASTQGRHSRNLQRQHRDALNTGDFELEQDLGRLLQGMPTGNFRYGNNRNWVADEKVRERKTMRRNQKDDDRLELQYH